MEQTNVIDSLRQRLLARRTAIVGRVVRTTHDALGEVDERPAEVEEEAQEQHQLRVTTQLGERGRAEHDAIDTAITRMESGDYGFCETCEEPIEVARLEVLPTARLCTTCAEARERGARLHAAQDVVVGESEGDEEM